MEGHGIPDHVHQCLSIPARYSVAYTKCGEMYSPDPMEVVQWRIDVVRSRYSF